MADRSNFQAAIKIAAKNWSGMLLERAKKNAPNHLKPHIYTRVVQQSPEKLSINLGVTMVDSFSATPRTEGGYPGAVVNGGSMDAAALEFGSEPHTIKPRKRTFKSGGVMKKYSEEWRKSRGTWLGVGMATQRSWMLLPNNGSVPVGAGKGFKANTTADGNFVFVKKPIENFISRAYKNGRGYLRISIRETQGQMLETEKKSIAKAIGMDIVEKFRKSSKVMFIE